MSVAVTTSTLLLTAGASGEATLPSHRLTCASSSVAAASPVNSDVQPGPRPSSRRPMPMPAPSPATAESWEETGVSDSPHHTLLHLPRAGTPESPVRPSLPITTLRRSPGRGCRASACRGRPLPSSWPQGRGQGSRRAGRPAAGDGRRGAGKGSRQHDVTPGAAAATDAATPREARVRRCECSQHEQQSRFRQQLDFTLVHQPQPSAHKYPPHAPAPHAPHSASAAPSTGTR